MGARPLVRAECQGAIGAGNSLLLFPVRMLTLAARPIYLIHAGRFARWSVRPPHAQEADSAASSFAAECTGVIVPAIRKHAVRLHELPNFDLLVAQLQRPMLTLEVRFRADLPGSAPRPWC